MRQHPRSRRPARLPRARRAARVQRSRAVVKPIPLGGGAPRRLQLSHGWAAHAMGSGAWSYDARAASASNGAPRAARLLSPARLPHESGGQQAAVTFEMVRCVAIA